MRVCDEKATFEHKHKEKSDYIRKIEELVNKGNNESAAGEVNIRLSAQISTLKEQLATLQKEFDFVCEKEKEIAMRNAALEEALVSPLNRKSNCRIPLSKEMPRDHSFWN